MNNNFFLFILILILLLLICVVRFDQKKKEFFDLYYDNHYNSVQCAKYDFLCKNKVEKWEYQPYFRERTIGIQELKRLEWRNFFRSFRRSR